MNEENQIIGGLKLTAPDTRNFKLGAIFELPDPKTLPTDFSLPPVKIKHQGKNNPRNDKCAAYATCSASEMQEGVELNPDFVFAVAKSYEGDEEGFGIELSSAFKAHTKVGAIEEDDVPSHYDLEGTKARYLKYWDTELIKKATKNRKASYFQVTGPYDHFDNIKSSIYKFKDKKQAVVFGCIWGWTNGHVYMTETQKKGFGHALLIVGWARRNGQDWLKIQNSGGEKAGEYGYHYFSRNVINDCVREYGALMMVDMEREDAEWYLNNEIKVSENPIVATIYKIEIIKDLISFMKKFLKTYKGEEGETPAPVVPPTPPAPVVEKPVEVKPKEDKLALFCKAIQDFEGFYKGSRSHRNNNPGNIKFAFQANTTGKDDKGFAIFKTYDDGFNCLKEMVRRACEGKSKIYKPDMTILQYFEIYAPSSDNNHPKTYASFVAKKSNLSLTSKIKELII